MINTIITKASKAGKFIDFRDNLVPAFDKDYAMMHGIGGQKKEYAPLSTIKIVICDYSKGTGDNSVTVSTNITTDVIYRLYNYVQSILSKSMLQTDTISEDGKKYLASALRGLNQLRQSAKEMKVDEKSVNQIGALVQQVVKEIGASHKAGEYDFNYSQERVDVYHKDAEGIAPIHKLSISRQEIRPDGKRSENPWYIKISNGRGKVKEQANGTSAYYGNTFQVSGQAFINLSDAEFFKALQKVARFIELWEQATCIPQIIKGREQRNQERKMAAQK